MSEGYDAPAPEETPEEPATAIVTRSNVELKGANPHTADLEPFDRLPEHSGAGASGMAPYTNPDGQDTTPRGGDGYVLPAEEAEDVEAEGEQE